MIAHRGHFGTKAVGNAFPKRTLAAYLCSIGMGLAAKATQLRGVVLLTMHSSIPGRLAAFVVAAPNCQSAFQTAAAAVCSVF